MKIVLCDACGEEIKGPDLGRVTTLHIRYFDNGGNSKEKDLETHPKCWRQTEQKWRDMINTVMDVEA